MTQVFVDIRYKVNQPVGITYIYLNTKISIKKIPNTDRLVELFQSLPIRTTM